MNDFDDGMMDDAGLDQTVESLAREANSRFSAGKGGEWILNGIVALSAILSAIFFWENSATVFSRVWPPAALVLGLAVGLLPSEGAFFGWRKVRETKTGMTNGQVRATTWGIAFAVFFSVFSTFALFVSGFPAVPDTIRQYSDWMTFIALAVPVLVQFSLFAVFVVNEQAVLQNHKRAKVSALRFDSLIRFEEAKVMAALKGMEAQLNRDLLGYGAQVGGRQGRAFLNRPRTATDLPENQLPASAIDAAAIASVLHGDQRPGLMDRLLGRRDTTSDSDAVMAVVQQMIDAGQISLIGNSTHDTARHDDPSATAANGHEPGQGDGRPGKFSVAASRPPLPDRPPASRAYAPIPVVVEAVANGSGQGSGHRVNQGLPTPNATPLPTPSRDTVRKRGGWIEFREKNGRRYARRRTWKKIDGQWRKTFEGRVAEIPVMTEKEYEYYVAQREQAKRIRADR